MWFCSPTTTICFNLPPTTTKGHNFHLKTSRYVFLSKEVDREAWHSYSAFDQRSSKIHVCHVWTSHLKTLKVWGGKTKGYQWDPNTVKRIMINEFPFGWKIKWSPRFLLSVVFCLRLHWDLDSVHLFKAVCIQKTSSCWSLCPMLVGAGSMSRGQLVHWPM